MKKIVLLAVAMLGILSCGNAQVQQAAPAKVDKVNKQENKKVMKPIELTKSEFLKRVANYETNPTEWKYLGNKPAIIDFYATWCGPCKRLSPMLEELQAEYGDQIVIYKVDVDKEQELAAVFGIRAMPTLLFIPMNGKPQMAQGLMPKNELKSAIDSVLLGK